MRIAMMTLNVYDNYGNMLQKYALYRTLKKFADSVEVLWSPCTKNFFPYELELNRHSTGNLRDAAFRSVREYKFKEFHDANIQTRFHLPYLKDLADDYDFFVVGSDQVWNPQFAFPGRFLDFAPPKKRIAYAASIAIPILPKEFQNLYRQRISAMPHVSLREKEGCDLVEKLTGKRPLQVLDPVFLLASNDWREIIKRPSWLNQKKYERGYVMTYFLGGIMPEEVKILADKLDLPTINMLDKNNFNHFVTGVEEFLYLISHANLICTNSFHATSFSLIFRVPFIVYRAGMQVVLERFSRLESLLELFKLKERLTDLNLKIKVDNPLKIDFTGYDEVLPLEKKKAFRFLANALWQ